MINPKHLESTFIVRNIALDYDNDEEFSSAMTDIKIERYRSFVSSNPSSTSYFQPILDVLEYKPSNLENIPDLVLLEGKNDFYTLSYYNDIVSTKRKNINLCPGMGAGTLDDLIRLYYAWGKNIVILLDSDAEGKKQKKRYIDMFGKIVEDRIYCLDDINKLWLNKGMEKLIDSSDRLKLQQACFPEQKQYKKKQMYLSIQELLCTKSVIALTKDTKNNLDNVQGRVYILLR